MSLDIVDLFAGPGGWSEGLRMLGLSHREVGIEWDDAACRTRAAAGHRTIRADVSQYPTEPFSGTWGLIASPPCQDFSMAGKRAGRTGEKGQLIDEVPRWVRDLEPEWFACEQVPPALDVWEEFAYDLRDLGYSTWAGVLNAADFGVPQTRKRAILIGSRVRAAVPPTPTHAKEPHPGLFGSEQPWVSMAEALGWGDGLAVDRRTNSRSAGGGQVPTVLVPMNRPSPSFTGKAGHQWVLTDRQPNGAERTADQPAPTITGSLDNGNKSWVLRTNNGNPVDGYHSFPADRTAPTLNTVGRSWAWERPATTVCADPRLGAPGHHDEDNRQFDETNGAIKLTVAEALTLQSFDPGYPVQGTKTKQFEQVGNAVPPLLAAHVIAAIAGVEMRNEAAA